MQASIREPVRDRMSAEANLEQLPTRHYAVLPRRQRPRPTQISSLRGFWVYDRHNPATSQGAHGRLGVAVPART
jgi:hypothetical protein